MTIFERAKIAAAATGVLVGSLMVLDIVFHFDWGNELFSLFFIAPSLVVMFIAAPFISKFIKYK